eukprot:TRINITY_DN1536_c1_g2_i2.p2 TRINITY_DN1536_c1_g2~~TRINITY_DN1536_c1_g2_i2.p2  ORF type:complete len:163 (-),score=19.52 TRINITY_DN1536_c1_g2_i2:159-620(-)
MVGLIVSMLFFGSICSFPILYENCSLPSMGFGAHQDPVFGFGDDYSFVFTNKGGDAVDSYVPGDEYLMTVQGNTNVTFRMTTIVDGGEFVETEVTGEPLCDGLRVNSNDVLESHTVQWLAGNDSTVTFSVNLAAACNLVYIQDQFMASIMLDD